MISTKHGSCRRASIPPGLTGSPGRRDPGWRGRLQQFKQHEFRRRRHRERVRDGRLGQRGQYRSAGLSAYLPGKKATGTPVKIGLINNEGSSPVAEPSTGDAAVAAADYANAELGGIGGHPIQVIRCAENEDVASATACANEMVQDNVAAVDIGTTGLGNTIVPIITKAGHPVRVGDRLELRRADDAGHVHVDRRVPRRPGRHGQARG